MSQSSKQIRTGAIISYLALAINIAATLIYIPWMVSVIGKANYALYTLAYSFISIFLMDFGLSSSVSKFVAQYRAENNAEKEKEFLATVSKTYIILDIIIAVIFLVLFFFLDGIYTGLTTEEMETFRWLYLIVASFSLISFPCMPMTGIMYAYEKIIELKLCELFQKLFSILLVVVALLYEANVIVVVLANVVSSFLTLIIKFVIIKQKTPVRIKLSLANTEMLKQIAGFTVWVTIQALAQRCIFTLAPTILGIVATSEQIALFAPASSIEGYFATAAAAIHGFFIMRITKYIIENQQEELYQLTLKVGRFQVLLLSMIYVVFLCVGEEFMCAWMGVDFRMASMCAVFLLLPDILIFSVQVANTAAIAKNLVREQSIGYIIMAIVCVGLSFPLSKMYGAVGSSIAIAISYVVLFIYNFILYTRKVNIDMVRFMKECYGRLIIPILLAGGLGYFVCSLIPVSGWSGVFVKGVVAVAIYIICVFRTLTTEERSMVSGLFCKFNVIRRLKR